MRTPKSCLIVGCGDIGTALGLQLSHGGWSVSGLRRNPQGLPEEIAPIAADLLRIETLVPVMELGAEQVVVILTPGKIEDEAYRRIYVEGLGNLIDALRAKPPEHLIFVSSSSVYGQCEGEWVDEQSPTEPTGFAGRRLLQAEALLAEAPFTATVVRYGGIYGPGRYRLIRQVESGRRVSLACEEYSNRIHRDDCVGVLAHLIEKRSGGDSIEPLYLASDSEPSRLAEVQSWLAKEMGNPPITEWVSGRGVSKRVSNRRLLASGYQFRYPDFRAGYSALLAEYRAQKATSE